MRPEELLLLSRAAMRERHLEPDFSAAAQREAAALGAALPAARPGVPPRDLRHLPWCSIDNDDSRDLDQLTVSQPAANGAVRVLVAIADVCARVSPGGAIDAHARANTTSVYTAGGVFPMLPLRLSTDLTSLNEQVDRAAIVVEFEVDLRATGAARPGAVAEPQVYRALVRNHAQLTYDGVAAWLDGRAAAPPKVAGVPGLEAQLRQQDRAGAALREARRARGALGLKTVESRPVFTDGVLTDLRADEGNRAKELIAGFMIAANGVTARFLDRHGYPSLRRLLREPTRWPRIREIAAAHGDALPEAPSALALDAFLTRRRLAAPERFAELSLTVVKLLGSGEYMLARPGVVPAGHFGLAVADYTHSTAPNRRYPDLVTQRLLHAALAGEPPPLGDAELAELARHCTEQEDNAAKVERQVRKSAAALLLAGRVGEQFDAVVTGVSDKGTWVRVARPVVEGRLVLGAAGLDVGDTLRVALVAVDAARGHIDFSRVG